VTLFQNGRRRTRGVQVALACQAEYETGARRLPQMFTGREKGMDPWVLDHEGNIVEGEAVAEGRQRDEESECGDECRGCRPPRPRNHSGVPVCSS
jgi:hypothetical protein